MQMSRNEIFEKLKDILRSTNGRVVVDTDKYTESSKLVTELGLSSVNILYMVIVIEETFGILFDSVCMSDFETIGDVVDYIEEKMQ